VVNLMSRLADWLASRGLDQVEVLAEVPNQQMDWLSRADRARLSGLLEQERTYHKHRDNPVARWNAACTRAEINRLLNP
jgi:hypothetical protein